MGSSRNKGFHWVAIETKIFMGSSRKKDFHGFLQKQRLLWVSSETKASTGPSRNKGFPWVPLETKALPWVPLKTEASLGSSRNKGFHGSLQKQRLPCFFGKFYSRCFAIFWHLCRNLTFGQPSEELLSIPRFSEIFLKFPYSPRS